MMKDYSYEILDLLNKYEGNTEAALAGEKSPQCLYAFSLLRENLLEWMEISKEARVLQIGSDYGACTGLLAGCAKTVVVLDPRDENLEVNRLRHGNRGNVFYVRGDLEQDMANGGWKRYKPEKPEQDGELEALMAEPFDFVFLSGVWDWYGKERAGEILQTASSFVKPGGILAAAAENETGVRYWMGAQLMETALLEVEYRGLFEELVKKQGGSFLMYYPVPDYRYPVSIYSDAYLPKPGDVTNISARLDGPGYWFGNEEEAMTRACQNGVFTKFANSFLGVWEKGNL